MDSKETSKKIINLLPYGPNFCFVNEILSIDDNFISGEYTFSKEHDFYRDHFVNFPITPGVILTECMAQIGIVCHGIYLRKFDMNNGEYSFVLTSSKIEFSSAVYPGEKVTVNSEKKLFRMGMIRCKVGMTKENGEICAEGELGGYLNKDK